MKLKKQEILIALDRDGTIIYDTGYFGKNDNWKQELKLYDGVVDMIRELNKFCKVVVTTNQIGVAYGYFTTDRVEEINSFIDKKLKKQSAKIDAWYYCPYVEKTWAEKRGFSLESPWVLDSFPSCRKPSIGMLESAAENFGKSLESFKIFVIGDSLDDVNMALNAGGTPIFFNNGKNLKLIQKLPKNAPIVKDFLEVINIVKENVR